MAKSQKRFSPIHPGEILRAEFMQPLGLSMNRLALDLRVPVTRIAEIVHERRAITPDTALRLARYFTTSAGFWLNLQTAYDLEVAEKAHDERDVVAVSVLHGKCTAWDGVVPAGDCRGGSVFFRDCQHVSPVYSPDFCISIVARQSHLVESVAGCQAQHFPLGSLVGSQQFGEQFGWHRHERRHTAGEFHPHGMFRRQAMLVTCSSAFAYGFSKMFVS